MKKKAVIAIIMAVVLALGAVAVFALDYYVPEDAVSVTARFQTVEPAEEAGDEFTMVSEDGELTIYITNDTLVYFEGYVPLSDECDGLTRMAREVLFGRTLAEVLHDRNLRVLFVESEYIVPISIEILFEFAEHPILYLDPEDIYDNGYMGIITLPEEIDWDDFYPENGDGFMTLPGELDWDEFDPVVLNGEIVVNGEILEDAPLPFVLDTENGYVVMVPLRAIAEALDYDVSWNEELRSVQIGVGRHIWIGGYEAHVGRMAPIELTTTPMIVDNVTFVSFEVIRYVLAQTAYVFEGQVVVETYSDMM